MEQPPEGYTARVSARLLAGFIGLDDRPLLLHSDRVLAGLWMQICLPLPELAVI